MANPALSTALNPVGFGFDQDRLTIDDVVVTTAAMLGVTTLVGAAAAYLAPASLLMPLIVTGAVGSFVLGLIMGMTRLRFNPVAVVAFAVLEGLFLGPVTRAYASFYDGVVLGAVIGTAAGFVGVLAAFSFGARLSSRGQRLLFAAMAGFVVIGLAQGLIIALGGGPGVFGNGALGITFALVGLGLSAFSLLGDFTDVEACLATGAPRSVRFALAWGLLFSLVWMYTNLLRLLAAFSSD